MGKITVRDNEKSWDQREVFNEFKSKELPDELV